MSLRCSISYKKQASLISSTNCARRKRIQKKTLQGLSFSLPGSWGKSQVQKKNNKKTHLTNVKL